MMAKLSKSDTYSSLLLRAKEQIQDIVHENQLNFMGLSFSSQIAFLVCLRLAISSLFL